eukprot:TRINITY_DN6529_c0_g1_i1.p1 TRINITY_DN6529_c0_g1~~TRINITY_DN6529_c0_g1_i1.p1  ORF type:complete len:683 (+),score=98.16 TRINITY_DN6529_c0_g1_i1:101-2149(+)
MDFLRTKVSLKKKRYRDGEFDLDLSFITDRIIAMGFPSSGIEGLYRNKMKEVKRFMEQGFAGHYKIYNLCSERSYKSSKFQEFSEYPFEDHNPPPFFMVLDFCLDIHAWLDKHPANVAVVHCKAGKGRTGTLICCYLLYSRLCRTSAHAIHYFGSKRTHDGQGVTIPSQQRYIRYFETSLLNPSCLNNKSCVYYLKLIQVRMLNCSKKHYIGISMRPRTLYYAKPVITSQPTMVDFDCSNVIIQGDVHIQLFEKSSKHKIFGFWINTIFIPSNGSISLYKRELDTASQDITNKISHKNLQVILYTEKIQPITDSEKRTPKSVESQLPRCSNCGNPVIGSSVSVVYLRSVFHWECLKCSRCHESLIDKDECVVEDNIDKLLCVNCSKFIEKCSGCGSPIQLETCREIDGIGLLCVNCYRCTTCKALLGWDNNRLHDHVVKDNKLYCLLHANNQLQPQAEGLEEVDRRVRPLPPNPILPPIKTRAQNSKPLPNNFRTFSAPPNPVHMKYHHKSRSTPSLPQHLKFVVDDAISETDQIRHDNGHNKIVKGLPFATCSKCRKPIDTSQTYVMMESENYHSKCFTCSVCHKLLPTGNSYHVKGDRIYCDLDFQRIQPNCEVCRDYCLKDFVRIKGTDRHIHTKCFKCKNCDGSLSGQTFFTGMSGLYCKSCWPILREKELPMAMSEL